jgi:hypothetical protein
MPDYARTFLDRAFRVSDPEARLRTGADLMAFERTAPDAHGNTTIRKIPQGVTVKVDEVRIIQRGADAPLVFAHARAEDGAAIGWTSSRNFEGKFVNQTLGSRPPPNNDRKGPHAAWSDGRFVKQLTLVPIVDAALELAYISADTLQPYVDMVAAAAADGITVAINSGFRSYPEQKQLYEGFTRGLPGYNQAAEPGKSKHQNGIAFDISVPGGAGDPCYDWLTRNAPQRGFVRTVNNEPWHWEYDTRAAQAAVAAGTFKIPRVTN